MTSTPTPLSKRLIALELKQQDLPKRDNKVAQLLIELFGVSTLQARRLNEYYPTLNYEFNRFRLIHNSLALGKPWEDLGSDHPDGAFSEEINAIRRLIDFFKKTSFPGPMMHRLNCFGIQGVKASVDLIEQKISDLAQDLFKLGSNKPTNRTLTKEAWYDRLPIFYKGALHRKGKEISWAEVFTKWCKSHGRTSCIDSINNCQPLLSLNPPTPLTQLRLLTEGLPPIAPHEDFAQWLTEKSLKSIFNYLGIPIEDLPLFIIDKMRQIFLKDDRERREVSLICSEMHQIFLDNKFEQQKLLNKNILNNTNASPYNLPKKVTLYYQLKTLAEPALLWAVLLQEENLSLYEPKDVREVFLLEQALRHLLPDSFEEKIQLCHWLMRLNNSSRSFFYIIVTKISLTTYSRMLALLRLFVEKSKDYIPNTLRLDTFSTFNDKYGCQEPYNMQWVSSFFLRNHPGPNLEPFLTQLHEIHPNTINSNFIIRFLMNFHYKSLDLTNIIHSSFFENLLLLKKLNFLNENIYDQVSTLIDMNNPPSKLLTEVVNYFRRLSNDQKTLYNQPQFLKAVACYAEKGELVQAEFAIRTLLQKFNLSLDLNDWVNLYLESPPVIPNLDTALLSSVEILEEFNLKPVQKILLSLQPNENKASWNKTIGYLKLIREFTGYLIPEVVFKCLTTHCLNDQLLPLISTLQDLRKIILNPAVGGVFCLPCAFVEKVTETAASVKTEFPKGEEFMPHLEIMLYLSVMPTVTQPWSDCFPCAISPEGVMTFKDNRPYHDLGRVARLLPLAKERWGIFRQWVGLQFEITLFQEASIPVARTIKAHLNIPLTTFQEHPNLCPVLKQLTDALTGNPKHDLVSVPTDPYEAFLAHLNLFKVKEIWDSLTLSNKKEIGIAYWNFIFPLLIGYRNAWAEISSQTPSQEEGTPEKLAGLGHIYEVEGGLSLLPNEHPLTQSPRFFLKSEDYKGLLSDIAATIQNDTINSFFLFLNKEVVTIEVTKVDNSIQVEMKLNDKSITRKYAKDTLFGPPLEGPLRAQLLRLKSEQFICTSLEK